MYISTASSVKCVSRGGGLKVYHEMNDNNNAYQIAGKLINARMGSNQIRMWKTRADAPAHSADLDGAGDTGNLAGDNQSRIHTDNTNERTTIPNDRI